MSRNTIARLLLALTLVGMLTACGKSLTAPDAQARPHDTLPWN